ncbi:MAG: dienelactone hydrolase family protein [Desulfovibrionaceae bacterium]|nr:dienelactone hydrolase family protein [Desulfovibrionaceae bacterium]
MLLVFCLSLPVAVSGAVYPGFKSLGIWNAEKNLRLDLAVWYPSGRKPFSVKYNDWEFRAARGAVPSPGKHPAIVLSHDSGGSRFSHHVLASQLASRGFVVIAPTHYGDNEYQMDFLFSTRHMQSRIWEIHNILDLMETHDDLAGMIRSDRIFFVGIGAGGTAAFLAAGAFLDAAGWKNACASESADVDNQTVSAYCERWARERLDRMAFAQDLRFDGFDSRFQKVVAIMPHYGMFLTNRSLRAVRTPCVWITTSQGGEKLLRKSELSALLKIFSLPEADTASLRSPCADPELSSVPELCSPELSQKQKMLQERLAAALALIFSEAEEDRTDMPKTILR